MNDCKCACHNSATSCSECYSNHTEPKYREGQTVSVKFVGTLERDEYGGLRLLCRGERMSFRSGNGIRATWLLNSDINIISQPRPKEPSGNGAVVRNSRGFNFVKNGKWWFDRFGNKFEWPELVHTDFLEILSEGV